MRRRVGAAIAFAFALQAVACTSIIGLDGLKDRVDASGDDATSASDVVTEAPPDASEAHPGSDAASDSTTGEVEAGPDGSSDGGVRPEASGMEGGSDASSTTEAGVSTEAGPDGAVDACVALTMSQACGSAVCGMASDGCQGMISCGTCGAPKTCGGGGTAGLCGDPNPGCTPASRYTVVKLGDGTSGSGLVYDSTTGFTWMRYAYHDGNPTGESGMATDCTNAGMTIPTEAQAQAIAGTGNYDSCAWPSGWDTWTSTGTYPAAFEDVGSGGQVNTAYLSNYSNVLCVTSTFP